MSGYLEIRALELAKIANVYLRKTGRLQAYRVVFAYHPP